MALVEEYELTPHSTRKASHVKAFDQYRSRGQGDVNKDFFVGKM
jgi:hypothetical protein